MYCFIICIVKLYENTDCGSGGKDWPCLPMIRSFWVYIYICIHIHRHIMKWLDHIRNECACNLLK